MIKIFTLLKDGKMVFRYIKNNIIPPAKMIVEKAAPKGMKKLKIVPVTDIVIKPSIP
jgi:hypothetical protein